MLTLSHLLSDLYSGKPATFDNLTVFPILGADPASSPEYDLLDDSVARGSVRITEVSESGSVPELLVWNNGDKPVLIIDGQELLGAKQNRVINLTVLVASRSRATIPVSCVEAGRWSFQSEQFQPAPHAQFAAARAAKAAQVTQSMEATGKPLADQSAVWEEIAQKSARLNIQSRTGAMAAMYTESAPQLEEYTRAFSPEPSQVGAIFSSNGRIAGVDIFDRCSTLAAVLPKLIRSYALDAIETVSSRKAPVDSLACTELLAELANSELHLRPAVGMGMDLRLRSPFLCGGGLLAFQQLVHLYAFRADTGPRRPSQSRLVRASRRRRPRE